MAIRCVGCVCVPVRESLCLLWREPHSKSLTSRSLARPEVDEERKVPEKKEGQLTKEDGEMQSTTESRGGRWLEIAVQGKDGQQKEAVREHCQRWVSIPRGFVELSRKIHTIVYKCTKSVVQTPFSCAWSWPKSVFVHLFFFFHPLGCILHLCNAMCDIPVGNHWMNH